MKKQMYKVIFDATKTLLNGNEYRVRKAVYMPRFDEVTGKHITPEQQIERGTAALKSDHYYNIEYKSTVATELFLA